MADEKLENTQEKEKGFFESLSLMQKIVLFVVALSFIFLAWVFIFGGINNIWELAFVIILAGVLFFIVWLIIFAVKSSFKQEYYSPKEDLYTRMVNMAIDYKPNNLNNLYFEGSQWKKHVIAGKIIGCLAIPYLIGRPVLDSDGKQKWFQSKLLKKKIPLFSDVTYGNDGDTLFVYEKGWFIFKKRHVLRCNHELHTDLNGDVIVHDMNPQPFGKFFEYPYKQLQKDSAQLMIQSQLEVIIATHEHQGDLISQASDAGTYYNPFFRLLEKQKAEIAREN